MSEKIGNHYKVVFLGDIGVGKTSLKYRIDSRWFEPPTLGADIRTLHYRLINENIIANVSYWDLIQYEEYQMKSFYPRFLQNYLQNSAGILLIFDVSRRSTFDNLENWRLEFEEISKKNAIGAVIGNKIDLPRTVACDEGKKYASKHHFLYCETSAKKNTNVKETFDQFLCKIFNTNEFFLIND
ncbi:MAG: ADP-ribosylation factor-like protein [Promethearchaeota archaeon]